MHILVKVFYSLLDIVIYKRLFCWDLQSISTVLLAAIEDYI